MPKTIPQLKKLERADPERVETVAAPYDWQKASRTVEKDPFAIKTVREKDRDRTVPNPRSKRR